MNAPSTHAPIGDARYVSLTTHRASGAGVAAPVWCAPLSEGRVGIWTSATSWTVDHLARDARVTLRPCDRRGRVEDDAPTFTGTGELLRSGGQFEEVLGRVRRRYGLVGWATMTLRATRRNDTAIVVTLDETGVEG